MKNFISTKFSLSVDELALSFSLVNRADIGKQLLNETYGKLDNDQISERLLAASHSMIARELTFITNQGSIKLDDGLEACLYPLICFSGIVQFIQTEKNDIPHVMNIHLGPNNTFTSHSVEQGVVNKLFYGELANLSYFLQEKINLPIRPVHIATVPIKLKMNILAVLPNLPSSQTVNLLRQEGIDNDIALAISKDMESPISRGSVVYTKINSETNTVKNRNETGSGLLFVFGDHANWLFRFKDINDDAIGELVLSSPDYLIHELEAIWIQEQNQTR